MNVQEQNERAKAYRKYADKRAGKSKLFKNCIKAFISGGAICVIGQCVFSAYSALSVEEDTAKLLVSVTLIFITALLTGIGIFDNIEKFSGAGTLVPITGFANAITASALDTKTEGFILGVGAKMFAIAGPVIVYGTAASVIYGVIYWIITLI